jgi:hypothetical protein
MPDWQQMTLPENHERQEIRKRLKHNERAQESKKLNALTEKLNRQLTIAERKSIPPRAA